MISIKGMKKLEEHCVLHGITIQSLMESAGKQVASIIGKTYDPKKVLVVAYHGNNGGDGFVAARYLMKHAVVHVAFLGKREKCEKEARANLKRLPKSVRVFKKIPILNSYDVIVDAVFGTGIHGSIRQPIASAIKAMNAAKAKRVSIDVPSGYDPDTGKKANVAIHPDMIIALHDIKKGLVKFRKKTVVVDIGIR